MTMTQVKRLREIFADSPLAVQPLGIRVNDTIYAGGLAGADPATGELAPDLESQMALALDHLKTVVEGGGASLDSVARCVAYVTTPDHREPADAVWMKAFPNEQDKPALKILTSELPPGQLVRLDAVGLVSGRRKRIDLPNISVHDPTVRMGNWVFSSRLHGTSPADGKVVQGGLDVEAAQIMKNVVQLVEAAGGTKDNIVQVSTFGNEPSYIPGARAAFDDAFPDPAKRPAFHPLLSWVRDTSAMMGEVIAVLDTAAVPDPIQATAVGERFEELFLAPEHSNVAAGVKLGPLVFAPIITGSDLQRGDLVGPDTYEQVRAILDNVDALMKAAGGGREQLGRVNFFMADVMDKYKTLNPLWEERFPDEEERPPHTYLPAHLPVGQRVSAEVFGLLGAPRRRSLYVDNMVHGDPMTLAAIIGNLVFSARISAGAGQSEDPVENAVDMFANVEDLLTQAGGKLDNLQQAVVSLHKPEHRKAVEDRWGELDVANKGIPFHFVEWDLGRGPFPPRLQMIAVV